jgi:hypothetical protein
VRPEELGKLKKFIHFTGSHSGTFWFVALCLNHYATAPHGNSLYAVQLCKLLQFISFRCSLHALDLPVVQRKTYIFKPVFGHDAVISSGQGYFIPVSRRCRKRHF